MKTMRRKGKATDLRNQTFRSNSRKIAYKFFLKDIAPKIPDIDAAAVKFEPITPAAIKQYFLWEGPTIFPWDDVADWKSKDAKGLDLAIWYKQILCGMCYATPRASSICLKIILLEGHPDRAHPLRGRIAPIALLVADHYARALGCKEIEIQDPDTNIVFYYRKLGFEFDHTNRLVISVNGQ